MAIYDCYRIRYNTGTAVLEMNTGGETWITVPTAEAIAAILTGYVSGAGIISATDTILQAINKLNGNDALKLPLAGGAMTGALTFTGTTFAMIPPKVTTTQRDAIAAPTAGMFVYNTTTNKLNVYTTTWEAVTSA